MSRRVIPVVKICDPDKPGDFLWINRADYDPDIHQPFGRNPPPPPLPPPRPRPKLSLSQRLSISAGLGITVARLWPWLVEQLDPHMLARFLDVEPRSTARALIQRRLRDLEAPA